MPTYPKGLFSDDQIANMQRSWVGESPLYSDSLLETLERAAHKMHKDIVNKVLEENKPKVLEAIERKFGKDLASIEHYTAIGTYKVNPKRTEVILLMMDIPFVKFAVISSEIAYMPVGTPYPNWEYL